MGNHSPGTGFPLTFACSKCRKRYGGIAKMPNAVLRWRLTGRRRALTKAQQGNGHPRALQYRVEYECLNCGHVGWSRQADCERGAVDSTTSEE